MIEVLNKPAAVVWTLPCRRLRAGGPADEQFSFGTLGSSYGEVMQLQEQKWELLELQRREDGGGVELISYSAVSTQMT